MKHYVYLESTDKLELIVLNDLIYDGPRSIVTTLIFLLNQP